MPDFAQPPRVRWACAHVRKGAQPLASFAISGELYRRPAFVAWPDDFECCEPCATRVLREVLRAIEAK